MGIYATGTVRANRKHMPILSPNKNMKHDWLSANGLSAIKWMDKKVSNFSDKLPQSKDYPTNRSKGDGI